MSQTPRRRAAFIKRLGRVDIEILVSYPSGRIYYNGQLQTLTLSSPEFFSPGALAKVQTFLAESTAL